MAVSMLPDTQKRLNTHYPQASSVWLMIVAYHTQILTHANTETQLGQGWGQEERETWEPGPEAGGQK